MQGKELYQHILGLTALRTVSEVKLDSFINRVSLSTSLSRICSTKELDLPRNSTGFCKDALQTVGDYLETRQFIMVSIMQELPFKVDWSSFRKVRQGK